jgi:hypothetical protein
MKPIASGLIAFILLAPLPGSSQENGADEPEPMKLERTESWTGLMSKEGVEVQYKYQACHDKANDIHKEQVLLRSKNTKDQDVTVSWRKLLWYDGKCSGCGTEDAEFEERIELSAGETLQGSCDGEAPHSLKVFARFLKATKGRPDTELTGLRSADMKVR